MIDNIVEGFEDPVREAGLAHELPHIFLAVEFGGAQRQRHERDIARDLKNLVAMPAGLIEEHDRVRTRGDLGCVFVEMELHDFAVAGRQRECGAGPAFGADRTEQTGRLGALFVSGAGA